MLQKMSTVSKPTCTGAFDELPSTKVSGGLHQAQRSIHIAKAYCQTLYELSVNSRAAGDPADLWSVFDALAYVSWHLSVIQQIHDIVEVAAKARLRHDTGVLAKDPSVLCSASACGHKVGVAEVLES